MVCRYCLDGDVPDNDRLTLYAQVFNRVNEYYQKLTKCAFDPACKNATRLSGWRMTRRCITTTGRNLSASTFRA